MVLDQIIKTSEQRFIEDTHVVSCGDDDTAGLILFDHQQEAIEDASDFANIVGHAALAADGIELVEEIHASSGGHRVEHLPQLGSRLPHELGDQGV